LTAIAQLICPEVALAEEKTTVSRYPTLSEAAAAAAAATATAVVLIATARRSAYALAVSNII